MRTVIVSRFPICREALSHLAAAAVGGEVESVCSPDEALLSITVHPVDMLVLEAGSGDSQLREVQALVDGIRPAPVALFAALSPAEAQCAYDVGVRGCVPKTAPPELVMAALKLIAAGGLYFSDFSGPSAKARPEASLRSRLSTRQLEVLKLIEIGQTNKEIAKALGISVATVKLHVQAILNVTGARNRTEAAIRARSQIR